MTANLLAIVSSLFTCSGYADNMRIHSFYCHFLVQQSHKRRQSRRPRALAKMICAALLIKCQGGFNPIENIMYRSAPATPNIYNKCSCHGMHYDTPKVKTMPAQTASGTTLSAPFTVHARPRAVLRCAWRSQLPERCQEPPSDHCCCAVRP